MRILLYLFLAGSLLVACQENFDQRLQREAREFTSNNCPQELEPDSRLDSITYDAVTRTLTSWYSLSPDNETAVKDNAPLLRRKLLDQLIADVNYKAVKDKSVIFRYVYRSQVSSTIIYDTQLKANEYKQ